MCGSMRGSVGRSMRSHSSTKRQKLILSKDASGLFGGIEEPGDKRLVSWNLVALQPEKEVGFTAQRTDFNNLVEPKKMRRHAAVDDICQFDITFAKRFDDGGGMNPGGGSKRVSSN